MTTPSRWRIIIGVILAIAITTTMDALGYSVFSALPLLPLMLLFWWLGRFSRTEIGMTWGGATHYLAALAYPLMVIPLLMVIAALSGAVDTTQTDWDKASLNLFVGGASSVLVLVLTEEGFFRGWLWGALEREGLSQPRVLTLTTVAFVVWHLSAVTLETGFDLPGWQIPIYLVNATLMGVVWGLLRFRSGSIVVSSVCHGVWNGMAYSMFGFGETIGALGVQKTWIYGPEVGVLGILANALFAAWLWRWQYPRAAQ